MSRSLGDLSLDELDDIAQQAGKAAAAQTRRAGISAFGIVDGVGFQVKPDGRLDVLGPVESLDDPFDHTKNVRRSDATTNGDQVTRPVKPAARDTGSRTAAARRD